MRRRTTRHRQHHQSRLASPPTLPQGEFTATIDELLTDGRGLATVAGKKVMISGALPNETVAFTYSNHKKQFYAGEAQRILAPSPSRVTPKCPVFSRCGGCVLQHLDSDKQLAFKQQQLLVNIKKQLGQQIKPQSIATPLSAEHWGYRRRARVGLKWQAKTKRVDMGFRGRASSKIVPTSSCAILAPKLSDLFPTIAELVATLSAPDCVTHVEMTLGETADHGEQIALTFRHTQAFSDNDKEKLAHFATQHHAKLYLQGNDSEQAIGLDHNDSLSYYLTTSETPLQMDFMPYHFTQVNFSINRKMVAQALEWLDLQHDDCVLDLFCGLGNFTLPIAQRVKQVIGIEGDRALVEWAKRNAANNHLGNATFYQADLTQDTQMMRWRVKYNYNKVLIDPPRAGAADVMPLIQSLKPEKICYVSCHGATLARDVKQLLGYGYRLDKMSAMDMFAQTAHVEAMVLLTRK